MIFVFFCPFGSEFLTKQLVFQMRSAVRNAAMYFPTAIISGRSRHKVCRQVFFFIFGGI